VLGAQRTPTCYVRAIVTGRARRVRSAVNPVPDTTPMSRFQRVYTDEQIEAITEAREADMTAPQIVERAAAGALMLDGKALPPFEANDSSIRRIAIDHRRRRLGLVRSPLADLEHRDAIEELRVRYVSGADHMLADFERTLKRNPAKADTERYRQIGRCLREAQALGGRNEAVPPPPGARIPGTDFKASGRTTGGLAAQIEAAHLREPQRRPVPKPPDPQPEPEPESVDPFTAMREAMRVHLEENMSKLLPEAERPALRQWLAEVAEDPNGSGRGNNAP
jgi:hypothetical protein